MECAPQGLMFDPWLFSLYINGLIEQFHDVELHFYADYVIV